MARREIQEINAGSMADIAFLLLIFFLVTTTMEVDAGISRTLPLKLTEDVPPQPPVHDRDILVIMANSQDMLFVEGQVMQLEDLEEKVLEFYTDNKMGEKNPLMPRYKEISIPVINAKLAEIQAAMNENPQDVFLPKEFSKWEMKLKVCEAMPSKTYQEISNSAIIQLKNQSNTSYGLYIEIQNVLKKVVNELRQKECDELGWGNYLKLSEKDPDDMEKIEILRVLVPERIIEAKIER